MSVVSQDKRVTLDCGTGLHNFDNTSYYYTLDWAKNYYNFDWDTSSYNFIGLQVTCVTSLIGLQVLKIRIQVLSTV